MLSFMQEQDRDLPLGTSRSTDTGHETPVTSDRSRDTSDAPPRSGTSDEKYVAVAAGEKQVRRSTYVFAGLFILGLLCLWFMIKRSAPQATAAAGVGIQELRIEEAITGFAGVRSEMFNRMGEIVKKFYQFSDVQQVDVHELVKNPFKLEMFLGDLEEISNESAHGARDLTHGMQLLSIMQTQQGYCCVIDDVILYEGDSIKGFKVRQISDSTVSLESGDLEITLKLSE